MNKHSVIERILNEKYGEYFNIKYNIYIGHYLIKPKHGYNIKFKTDEFVLFLPGINFLIL